MGDVFGPERLCSQAATTISRASELKSSSWSQSERLSICREVRPASGLKSVSPRYRGRASVEASPFEKLEPPGVWAAPPRLRVSSDFSSSNGFKLQLSHCT